VVLSWKNNLNALLFTKERKKGAKVIVRAKVPAFVVPTSGLLWTKNP